jgi:hypothetical protein
MGGFLIHSRYAYFYFQKKVSDDKKKKGKKGRVPAI